MMLERFAGPAAILPLLATMASMALPVQAAFNAKLSTFLGNPLAATSISFTVGAVALFCATVTVGAVRYAVPGLDDFARVPPWLFLVGGVLGACYLLGNVILVASLGAATLFAFGIAGQLLSSIALDHFGLFGLAAREASLGRLLGAVLVLAGAVMVRSF